MKLTLIVPALAVLLSACSQAPNGDTAVPAADNAPMPAAEHAPMADQTTPASGDMAQPTKTASAMGTVDAVDAMAGKISIAHGPVDALGWPAMTMSFKATPEQIGSVQAGQKVEFEFESQGMDGTITRITPMK